MYWVLNKRKAFWSLILGRYFFALRAFASSFSLNILEIPKKTVSLHPKKYGRAFQ